MTWWYENEEKKMEFDKSRVYTALNADELRAGDKVITARCMADLKTWVAADAEPNVIELIQDETNTNRFTCKCFGSNKTYDTSLAYLVEKAENCTNCGEGKWDVEHKKIYCDPVNCGNGNVVFRNHEIEVCEYWKPITKQKAENYGDFNCEAVREAYNEKHYRPFKDTDELIEAWDAKCQIYGVYGWQNEIEMPHIWVRDPKRPKCTYLLNGLMDNEVYWGSYIFNMQELFDNFEFLDGSPCGVEE